VNLSRISYLVKLQLSETYRGAARHCARWKCTIVQLVSFSLMPYRVDENDDGRGNFDRAFPRRNWNCAWIIMNASSSEPTGPTTIEGERRIQIYLHIFHPALLNQLTWEWLYSHRSYARDTWEIGKINICSLCEIFYLLFVFTRSSIFYVCKRNSQKHGVIWRTASFNCLQ